MPQQPDFSTTLIEGLIAAESEQAAAAAALAPLLKASGWPMGGVFRYRAGSFAPLALTGDFSAEQRAQLQEDLPPGQGCLWQAYRRAAPLFIEDYPAHPDAHPRFVALGIKSAVYYPVFSMARPRAFLVLRALDRHHCTEKDLVLLRISSRALGLALEQFQAKARLEALLDIQRNLLAQPAEIMYERILEMALKLVPGAEGGSLLVRSGERFSYQAVTGFLLERLQEVSYDEAAQRDWYGGPPADWQEGQPRILSRSSQPLEAVSFRTAKAEVMAAAGRVPEIQANLNLPIAHQGRVLATLNLDAFSDPEAFADDSLQAARMFAPPIAYILHEAQQRRLLEAAAHTDALTDLPNRRAFDRCFEDELERAKRGKSPLSLLLMDLRGFKGINDQLGHTRGDEALRLVARGLRAIKRRADSVYRWGGDEFVVLLPDTSLSGAIAVGERYAATVASLAIAGTQLGMNIGVASYPESGETRDALLQRADAHMYRAKAEASALVADSGQL